MPLDSSVTVVEVNGLVTEETTAPAGRLSRGKRRVKQVHHVAVSSRTSLMKPHPNVSRWNRLAPVTVTSGLVRHTDFCLSTVSYRPDASASNTRNGHPTTVAIPGTGSFGIVLPVSLLSDIVKSCLHCPPCHGSKNTPFPHSSTLMVRRKLPVHENHSADRRRLR